MARFTLHGVVDFDSANFAAVHMSIEDADSLGLTNYTVVVRDTQDTDVEAALDHACMTLSDEDVDAFIHANADRLYAEIYPSEIAMALFRDDMIGKTVEINTL